MPALDPRDKKYLLQPPVAQAIERRYRYWITAPALDQGAKPHCVAFSGHQFLLSSPVKNPVYKTTDELYTLCQRNDEWEGESPVYEGTSVRALFKVLQQAGYVSEYRWAFDADTVARHVLATSPVVVGTTWHAAMFYPDAEGFIHAKGASVGGHAYMVCGVNLDKKCPDGSQGAFRIINSWGASWAQNGKAWISMRDMNLLISDFGEACASKELKFTAKA